MWCHAPPLLDIIWNFEPQTPSWSWQFQQTCLKIEFSFFLCFLPVCPPENDQLAESQAHVNKDHDMGILVWSHRHQQPPVLRFPPLPTTSRSLPPASIGGVVRAVGGVIRGNSAACRGRLHATIPMSWSLFTCAWDTESWSFSWGQTGKKRRKKEKPDSFSRRVRWNCQLREGVCSSKIRKILLV